MNNLVVSGRIIRVTYKDASEMGGRNALLKLNVSVNTGERKKEGETYAPSYIIEVPIWGNFATALQERAVQGATVVVSGTFAAPTIYLPNEGEPRINLGFDKVAEVTILSSSSGNSEEQETPKAETTKKKKTAAKRVENFDDEDDEDSDSIPF
jgi:single-stranded DNA-binding protein